MLARLLTILVCVPIIFACTYFGGVAFLALVLVLALFSINEFYYLMKQKGLKPAFILGNFFTVFFLVIAYLALKKNWEPAHSAVLTSAVIGVLGYGIFLRDKKESTVNIAVTLFGIIYVGWLFSYFMFIRSLTPHGAYLFFLMITIWANDIAAYVIGSFIGRTKLSPYISPKKTIEGAVAGFVVCLIAAFIFGYLIETDWPYALLLGAIVGVLAQVSDLVESLIKRDVGAKDSSPFVPGHGGVLDRMDSFILTAPVMYYYLVWLLQK